MKIKDYTCKCGHDDFFFETKGNQKGIYCTYCGKWLKWADKDERNLADKPTGKWIFQSGAVYDDYICSCCGYKHPNFPTKYCPNCGKLME